MPEAKRKPYDQIKVPALYSRRVCEVKKEPQRKPKVETPGSERKKKAAALYIALSLKS